MSPEKNMRRFIMIKLDLAGYDKYFEQMLLKNGFTDSMAHFTNLIILGIIVAVIAIAANFILKQIIIKIIKRWVDKSENTYDDVFYEKGVFNRLSHFASALLISYLAPIPLADFPKAIALVKVGTNIYMLVIVILVINSVINALHEIYNGTPLAKNRSIKGYIQMSKGIIYFIGGLLLLSILINKDLSALFTGLTAFAAVLMFVFKDAILGLIAGIQISSNDIIRIGDYIEMPKRDTDGTVIDISLSVVKVHNTNRTISTIPTYAFVSESFWNWRGLEISEGRRIRRFLYLDMSTIKPCDDKLLFKLREVELLKPYFEIRDKEYQVNEESNIWHGKYYTNATLFRAYVEAFLRNNPNINISMNLMVRHLQPTEHGLPIEIYTYAKEKKGPLYEAVQADIFDHIIASVPEFGLKLFQKPSGYDVRNS